MEVADLEDTGIAETKLGTVAYIAGSIVAGHWQKAAVVEVGMAVGSLLVEGLVVVSSVIQKGHGTAGQQRRPMRREAGQEW
jgi:hypothetical protein